MTTWIFSTLFVTSMAWAAKGINSYSSPLDNMLTIHKMGVLPAGDNVGGIYARYVENRLRESVKKSHRFDLKDLKNTDAKLGLDDYSEKSELVSKVSTWSHVDALLCGKLSKANNVITLTLGLFLGGDGKLLLQEETTLEEKFSTADVEKATSQAFDKLVGKLPYRGLVLSRQGNRVTVDLGLKDGVKDGAMISAAQIISLNRHPRFNFVINSEKEILGKIKIIKAEQNLSFGVITTEKEQGLIQKNSKLTGLDFVIYKDSEASPSEQQAIEKGKEFQGTENPIFGKEPKEWVPPKQPGLGKIGLSLGLGSLHNAVTTQLAGSIAGDVPIYPQLELIGELWLTPTWFLSGRLGEGMTSISNPLSSSSPGNLAATNSHYAVHGGYKFLLEDDFTGSQVELHLGAGKYSFFVDSSTPLAFTSISYYGVYFGLGGSMPITADKDWYLNVLLNRYFSPGYTESPVTSSSSTDNTGTEFFLGASHKVDPFWLTFRLNFEFYSTNFTGQGTRTFNGNPDTGLNASHSLFTLFGGLEYFF